MTEERDPEVSAAYRGLGAQEPPRALDEAILAAARREAGARPAPLAVRAARQRWYAPLATAAVLVLAVAVTLNMQIERPGIESPAQRASAPPPQKEVARIVAAPEAKDVQRQAAAPAAPAPSVAPEPAPFMAQRPAPAAGARSDDARDSAASVSGSPAQPGEERRLREAQAPAPARAPQAAPAEVLAKRSALADRAELGAAATHGEAAARMQVQKLADTPERELERIAELRAQGRHEEADKALAEFRKRHPDYRIPDAMRVRIERR